MEIKSIKRKENGNEVRGRVYEKQQQQQNKNHKQTSNLKLLNFFPTPNAKHKTQNSKSQKPNTSIRYCCCVVIIVLMILPYFSLAGLWQYLLLALFLQYKILNMLIT